MADAPTYEPSSLLDYLPAIYQEDPFLGQFLLAFEKIVLGRNDPVDLCYKDTLLVSRADDPDICYSSLTETIAGLATFFDPQQTREDFLPWLASWVALTLRSDWREDEQRRLLARIVTLYKQRGTPAGLEDMLRTYTGMGVKIYELLNPMQIGMHSTVGDDTVVGEGRPHYFIVKLILTSVDPNFARRVQIAQAIIEQEKPAHTYYNLQIELPTIQIGVQATLGLDNLIGTPR